VLTGPGSWKQHATVTGFVIHEANLKLTRAVTPGGKPLERFLPEAAGSVWL